MMGVLVSLLASGLKQKWKTFPNTNHLPIFAGVLLHPVAAILSISLDLLALHVHHGSVEHQRTSSVVVERVGDKWGSSSKCRWSLRYHTLGIILGEVVIVFAPVSLDNFEQLKHGCGEVDVDEVLGGQIDGGSGAGGSKDTVGPVQCTRPWFQTWFPRGQASVVVGG